MVAEVFSPLAGEASLLLTAWMAGTNETKELMNAQQASPGASHSTAEAHGQEAKVYKTLEHIGPFQRSVNKYVCFISLDKTNYTAKSEGSLESVLSFDHVSSRD